ncbi:YlxR family protein [Mycoplasmoides pirum]|nr:YlxR family protein [Mycoplasmoides pirum]
MKNSVLSYRMCVVTKKHFLKKELIRIVLKPNKEQVLVDWNQSELGRGLYLQKNKEIIEKFFNKKIITKIFKINLSNANYEFLKNELSNIKI